MSVVRRLSCESGHVDKWVYEAYAAPKQRRRLRLFCEPIIS